MENLAIMYDEEGNKVVIIPDIIFVNKQNIDWDDVEEYLERYVGQIVEMSESKDIIYLGKDFPDEFAGSKYTRQAKSARAKATTRFALPVYENERKTAQYNVYTGCLVVNCTLGGKMYLYDLVDIKKEASNPLKTTK